LSPFRELSFDGSDDAIEEGKVAVVEAESAGEFPDSFDGIQFGAVGRQEVQAEIGDLLDAPFQMQFRG
jgi:hypothetical protein